MTEKFLRVGTVVALAAFFGAGAWAKGGDSLQVKGSDTMVNLVQSWAESYMEKHPDSFIAVTGGGSGTGLAALIGGTCDLAMSSREIKKQEIKLAQSKGVDPKEIRVALDGLAVVVHPENPVDHLSVEQLAGIFTGQIKNWKEVGGADASIVILSREVNSGTHVYFQEHVLSHVPTGTPQEFASGALLMSSSQAIADEVSQNTNTIGYYGMGYISSNQKALAVSQGTAETAVQPTIDNVISGAYPISRPLYFYTNGEPSGPLKEFFDFILSPEGQTLVGKNDFVPIAPAKGA